MLLLLLVLALVADVLLLRLRLLSGQQCCLSFLCCWKGV